MIFGTKKNEPAQEAKPQAKPEAKPEAKTNNGQAAQTDNPAGASPELDPDGLDPEMAAKIAAIRVKLHETFGKVTLAMMTVPRYRNLSLSDLGSLVLDPLMRDRVAIASPAKDGAAQEGSLSGIAIWASVSEEVDAKIREQIKAGTFPIRLKAEDWNSGSIN